MRITSVSPSRLTVTSSPIASALPIRCLHHRAARAPALRWVDVDWPGLPRSRMGRDSEPLRVDAADRQPIADAVLLGERVPQGLVRAQFVAVVARRQPADVGVRGGLVVVDPDAAVDPHEAVALRGHHAHPRIRREIAVLEPPLGAVHEDLVAIEQIPHHGEMWGAVGIARADDGEARLLEEGALLRREPGVRHQRKRSRSAGRTYSRAVSDGASITIPRTIATGQRSSLPITSSAAAAISSATAISVTRSS